MISRRYRVGGKADELVVQCNRPAEREAKSGSIDRPGGERVADGGQLASPST